MKQSERSNEIKGESTNVVSVIVLKLRMDESVFKSTKSLFPVLLISWKSLDRQRALMRSINRQYSSNVTRPSRRMPMADAALSISATDSATP